MSFTHMPMSAHPSLVASYCKKCNSFVAASPRPSVLKSAEQAHVCDIPKIAPKKRTGRKSN